MWGKSTCINTLHCSTFHSITLHYIILHYITLHHIHYIHYIHYIHPSILPSIHPSIQDIHTYMHKYIHKYINNITLRYVTLQYVTLRYIYTYIHNKEIKAITWIVLYNDGKEMQIHTGENRWRGGKSRGYIHIYRCVCVHILVVDIMVDFVHKHYLKYHGFLE